MRSAGHDAVNDRVSGRETLEKLRFAFASSAQQTGVEQFRQLDALRDRENVVLSASIPAKRNVGWL